MPEMVVMRVPMEGPSEPEIVEERSSVHRAVERIVAFVREKHQPSTRAEGRGRGWRVERRNRGNGAPLPAERMNPLVSVSSSGPPDLRLLGFGVYQHLLLQ